MAHLGDRVAAYVDGQLPDDEASRADAHLATCDACFDAVLAQRMLKRRMTGLGMTPSPSSTLLSALSDPVRLAAAAPPTRMHMLRDHLVVRATLATSGAFAVLAGIGYVMGAPQVPADTVSPPVDRFVAQFRGDADPVAQSVRAAGQPPSEVALAVVPGHAVAPATGDSPEAVAALERALGSSVSVRLLATRYDLSLAQTSSGRTEVVVADAGHRVATYVIDDRDGSVSQIVRYAQQSAADPVMRVVRPVTRADVVRTQAALRPDARAAAGASLETTAAADEASGDTPAATMPVDAQIVDRIDAATIQELSAVGWPCHDRLGRALERVDAQWVDLAGDKAIALTYTDGVSTLTVYEQNGALDRESTTGFRRHDVGGTDVWVRDGSPAVATWDSAGIVFTVVTDGPSARLREAVSGLPRHADETGLLARIRTGLARLTDWATPGSADD